MKKYIQLLRVQHWLKNILIFLPLIFSKNLFNVNDLIMVLVGSIAFSFIASIVYINNDIHDIENDRKHSKKKKRPLASGKVSVKTAIIYEVVLGLFSILLLMFLYFKVQNLFIVILPVIYLLLNYLYSKGLKNIAIIDIVILVSGFVIRVLFGALIISVELSNWLYLMVMFGSFYLGLGKRRNEFLKIGVSSRKVLTSYNKDFLDKNMYSCLTLSIFSYSMWCIDPITLSRIDNQFLIWTIPFVMIIFMLYSLEIEKDSLGDPVEVILKSKSLISMVGLYGFVMFLLLYVI